MYEDKTKEQVKGSFKKSFSELKADLRLDWKTIKEQFRLDMYSFGKFLKRLFITDKK